MSVFDLSHTLNIDTPAYPGTPGVSISTFASIPNNGYRELELNLATHSGTHMDAPAHMLNKGAFLDELPLNSFYGKGLVVDASHSDSQALSAEILPENCNTDFVLFCTGWDQKWNSSAYFESFPYLSSELVHKLAAMNIKGVGMDGPSVDALDSEDFEAHHALLGSGKVILENLTGLRNLLKQSFMLYAFPLKIEQSDGAPVRAVAITEEIQ